MSYAVLVLTDDNFAPVNTSDDRLVHGFSLNERFDTLHDWRLSPYGSHTMALGALLARHVRISAADLYGSCDQEQASPDLSALTVEQLQEDELWGAARFYTMSEFSSGQIDYICAHFDAICLFLNHPLDEHCTFPLTISSLLLAPNCPPSFIFNLCLAPELTNPHSTVIPKLSLQLFLQQALPQAYLVHTLDPNAGCVQVVPPERPGSAAKAARATSAAAAAGRNAENKAGRNEESWVGARVEERPQWRLKSSFNALFFFQPQATRRALARLEQVLAPGGDAPVIALSSTLFTRHARLGLSPEALALCQALRQLWPKAHLVVVLGKGIFSYAPLYSDATWLLSEQPPRWGNMAAHWCTELNAALLQHARTQAALSCGEVSASEVCVPEAAAQPWIEGCFLGHSYEEYQHFLAEVDLLITEYACEQVLAASCGTPTLGLTLDLNLEEPFPTQSIKKDTKYSIIESVAAAGLDLTNKDEIWTRTNYNKYKIDYSSRFAVDGVKPNLYVETYYSIPAFPTELREVSSLLYEFLRNAGFDSIVAEYELAPFEIRVQSIVRTFIDKVFAVCDCYLDGRVTEHSRHLYDIYKIYPHIKFDDEIVKMVAQTREVRRNSQKSSAAEVGVDISRLLQEIIDRKIYKSDYRDITRKLLFEEADYDAVIGTLQDIATKSYFT